MMNKKMKVQRQYSRRGIFLRFFNIYALRLESVIASAVKFYAFIGYAIWVYALVHVRIGQYVVLIMFAIADRTLRATAMSS
jgi:Tfp pilus assembly protein PilP